MQTGFRGAASTCWAVHRPPPTGRPDRCESHCLVRPLSWSMGLAISAGVWPLAARLKIVRTRRASARFGTSCLSIGLAS